MKIYQEVSLKNFEFWGGAKIVAELLTTEELDCIEEQLAEIYPEGVDETTLNDIMWFDDDYIAQILGYTDFEELYQERRKK